MPAPRMRVTDFAVRGSLSSKLVATRTPSRRQSGWPSLSTLCPARSAFDGRPSPVHRKGLVDTHSIFGEIGVHGIHPPPRGKAAGGHAGARSVGAAAGRAADGQDDAGATAESGHAVEFHPAGDPAAL